MIDKTRIKNSRFDILEKDQSQIQKYIEKEAKKSEKQRQKEEDAPQKKYYRRSHRPYERDGTAPLRHQKRAAP